MNAPNRTPPHHSVQSILELIKVAGLTNEQLNDLRNRISELIVYKHEFDGTVYTLDRAPPMQEEDLKVDEKESFTRLVVPYINTYSFTHINNLNDLAVAVQLIHKNNMKIVPHAFKLIIEELLGQLGNIEKRLLTREGRRAIRKQFQTRIELFDVDFKEFIQALRHKKGDLFTKITPLVAIALLKILIMLL